MSDERKVEISLDGGCITWALVVAIFSLTGALYAIANAIKGLSA